jgi:Ohr subfamily peroxiredoxin
MNVLYSIQATATGGREGHAKSADGVLDINLTVPKQLGGGGGNGANPEMLFAAGYSACFLGALKYVAGQKKVKLTDEANVTATVGIGQRDDGKGFGLDIALSVTLPGVDRDVAEELVAQAEIVCPYSHLAHNGAAVRLSVA